ncbi:MAG: division/cell wall cluster transcriptional repressor MraZ [Prevotella sp.]
MRFLGTIEAKTDQKGRSFLPASFRKQLQTSGEENMILRKDVFQPCLVLYPESVWNAQMDELRCRLSRWDKRQQAIFRMFVSDVEPVSLDGNGRFLIPKLYLNWAVIAQPLCFFVLGHTIVFWGDAKHDCDMSTEEFGQALEEIMNSEDK